MEKLKIVVAGPEKSGKSTIVNMLTDQREVVREDEAPYIPTVGCRIIEIERMTKGGVELWDSSGNLDDSSCWPAIGTDANGVIFVYNNPSQEKELTLWHDTFAKKYGIHNKNVLLIMFHAKKGRIAFDLPTCFESCTTLVVQQQQKKYPTELIDGVDKFISSLYRRNTY